MLDLKCGFYDYIFDRFLGALKVNQGNTRLLFFDVYLSLFQVYS